MAFHIMMFWGSPLIHVNKRNSISWKRAYVTSFRSMDFTKTPSERPFQIQFSAHQLQKSSKIWKDGISRNGHRIKVTRPNSMILVSFSSAEDALTNDVKKYDTFTSQGTENPLFCFFGTTGIMIKSLCNKVISLVQGSLLYFDYILNFFPPLLLGSRMYSKVNLNKCFELICISSKVLP